MIRDNDYFDDDDCGQEVTVSGRVRVSSLDMRMMMIKMIVIMMMMIKMIVVMMILMTMTVVRGHREWAGESLLLDHGVDGEDDYNIVDDYDDDHVDKTNYGNVDKYQLESNM